MGEGELATEHMAQPFFDSFVHLFGLPDEVLHYRDPRCTADFWRHLWESMGSRAVLSSAYHPQTDGKVECAHRTIKQTIRCMLAKRSLPPEAWCRVIGALELGLNTAIAESTGKPPSPGGIWGAVKASHECYGGFWGACWGA